MTAPPSPIHCKERRIGAGSLPSSCNGHAPSSRKQNPAIGQLNAASQARNLTGRLTRDPELKANRSVTVGGITIHVTHGHELGRPTPALLLARYSGDVIVFGHTHRAVVMRADGGRMAINPGAAGPRRFDLQPSVARLTIRNGDVEPEIISLA